MTIFLRAILVGRAKAMHSVRYACVGAFLLATAAGAQVSADSIITTSARAEWHLVPDRVTFYVMIDATGVTGSDAIAKSGSRALLVRQAVAGLRLPVRVVAEEPIFMAVITMPERSATPTSFVARFAMRVHVQGVDSLAKVFAAAFDAGGTVSTISYESWSADSVRHAALPGLIATAKGDAEAIARSLGGRLGPLVEVHVLTDPIHRDYRHSEDRPKPKPEVSVPLGVTLRYRLVRS